VFGKAVHLPGLWSDHVCCGDNNTELCLIELSLFIKYSETLNCFSTAKLLDVHVGSGTHMYIASYFKDR